MSSDKERFAIAMLGLAEEFGGTLSEAGLKLKWESLKKYPIDLVLKGISYLIDNREKTYPPVPMVKEILTAMEIIQNPEMVISIDDMAEFQANEVLAFFKQNGSNAVPEFKDALTHRLMTTAWPYNSWGRTLTEDNKPRWKRDFINSYKAYTISARECQRLNIPGRFKQLTQQVAATLPLQNQFKLLPRVSGKN